MNNRICVGRIGGAHGTDGEVRLWPYTSRAEDVALYGPLQTSDGRVFEIASLRPGKASLVARLKGVTDRTAAERLCNTDLYVPRERLPEPAPGEFYHADLIGLGAENTAGHRIGTIVAIHNFGASDILEIAQDAGGETLMLSFSTTAVPSIEIAAKRIVVVLPEQVEAPEEAASGAAAEGN